MKTTTTFSFLLAKACLLFTMTVRGGDAPKLLQTGQTRSVQYGFIENKGQVIDQLNRPNPAVKFLLNTRGLNVQLRSNGFSYDTYVTEQQKKKADPSVNKLPHEDQDEYDITYKYHRVDISFIGANANPEMIESLQATDYINYFTTGTSEQGVHHVRHFGMVTYLDLYPGIDLVFESRPGTSKPVEYNFIVHPGANPSLIRWKYEGTENVSLVNGAININTSNGRLQERIPLSFEKENNKRVSVNYVIFGNNEFSFDAAGYDKAHTLVIDPLPDLKWGTYYGDALIDNGYSMTSDVADNLYFTGCTTSTTAIATTGAFQTTMAGTAGYGSGGDVLIAKFNGTGVRQWATYYGYANNEIGHAIKLSSTGDIYIYGTTSSTTGMGTTGTFQAAWGGGSYNDAFLAKFTNAGVRVWGTYYGGSGNDRGVQNGLVLDASDNIYITGTNNTVSGSAITTSGAFQTTNGSTSAYDEPFAAKFNPSGGIIWGTYFGGGGNFHDGATAIALDASNNVYVTGNCTATAGVATAGAHQGTYGGGTYDAYIAKLNSTGTAMLWCTYYGGALADVGTGIAVDVSGNILLSGYTTSTSAIATTGAYQTTFAGGTYDAFVAKFNASGVRQWGTYYGGSLDDIPRSGRMDNYGNYYIAGDAVSTSGIATMGAWQTTYGGGARDAMIVKFNTSGMPLWGTYYGGALEDLAFSIEVNRGSLLLSGRTVSTTGIATPSGFQTVYGGGTYDCFFAKFQESQPSNNAAITAFVSPTKFCVGTQPIKVRIKNNGVNRIDSVMVNWELDGLAQTPLMWRSVLDTAGGLGRNDTVVTLGSVVFTAGIARTVRAWTFLPNNTIDTVPGDDSVFVTLKAGLNGTYTIDPFTGDFTSFTAAVYELNTYGHCGPVTFNVSAGASFTENPVILSRSGTITDSIVFQKNGFGANPVVYGKNGVGASDAVIALVGASYITFDGIDVADSVSNATANTQIEYGYGITNATATQGSSRNRIKNTRIVLRRTNANTIGLAQSTFVAAATSLSGANHNNRYENIRVENSYNGILLAGTAAFPDSNNVITSTGSDTTVVGSTAANDIGNGTTIVYGILVQEQKNVEVSKAVVRNLTHTGTLLPSGIWVNNISTTGNYGNARIFNNIVQNLSRTNTTATGGFTGIRIDVSANATAVVYNNVVCGMSTANPASASATMLLRGIGQGVTSANGNAEYYHNSVSIVNTSLNSTSAAFWKAGTGSCTSRNNIFSCVSAAQTGVAKHYASYISAGTVAASSHNVLWAPNANGFIGYAGAADKSYLQAYAAAVSPAAPSDGNERGSAVADPGFTGPLTLSFLSSTPAVGSGTPITNPAITTDIEGTSRGSRPTIGAYETVNPLLDSAAPVISNVIASNSSVPSVYATIIDNSNLAATDVRLWYRAGSSGAFTSLSPDSVPTGSSGGTYKWGTSFTSFAIGSYQFYIAARDAVSPGLNIAVNPIHSMAFAGFQGFDPVNYIGNPDASANTRTLVKTSAMAGGTYTVGTGGTFTKLTHVAYALDTTTIAGNVVFELLNTYDGTTGETFPITFNQGMSVGGNWKVTIRPATGVTARVTAGDPGPGNPLINFNGTDRIEFNGRPGGVGALSQWTIRNTRATSASSTIRLMNDAMFDTLRYLKIEGQNAMGGTIEIGTTTGTQGNDYNAISYNQIRDRSDVAGTPVTGVYCSGSNTATNDSNMIADNIIYNWTTTGIHVTPTGNGSGWIIHHNSFEMFNAGTTAQTSIRFEAGSIRNRITNNRVGGSSGSPWINTGSVSWRGIVCNAGTADSTYVHNNTIQDLVLSGTGAGTFAGIEVTGGLHSIRNNTIGHNDTANSIVSSLAGVNSGILFNGITASGLVFDNTVANVSMMGNVGAASHSGILVNAASPSAALVIRNNRIHDLSSASVSTSTAIPAIGGIVALQGLPYSISDNAVYNLNASGNATTLVAGINISGTTATGNIASNKIHGLKGSSGTAGAMVAGIHIDLAQGVSVSNNFVSLGYNMDSSGTISGIYDKSAATANAIYFNTVLVSGSAVSTVATTTYGYRRATSAVTVVCNNILKNTRTGNGAHYAIANTPGTSTATGWASNSNALFASNALQIGLWNTTATNFASWRSISLHDSASVDYPASFVSNTDLHLTGTSLGNLTLGGRPIAGITTDIDGQTRHAFVPYMGADENTPALPVTLVDLHAHKINDDVLVNWITSQEINSDRFEVERSLDGTQWLRAGSVKATGNVTGITSYRFNDRGIICTNPSVVYYRLKMIDQDGSFDYSKVVAVTMMRESLVASVSVAPNPFNDQLGVYSTQGNCGNISWELVDVQGRIILSGEAMIAAGSQYTVFANTHELKAGLYFLSVSDSKETRVMKVLK